MAKRFTDSDKFKGSFIRGLKGSYKLLWEYLNVDCDHAGIWHVDFQIARIYLGEDMPVNEADSLKYFNQGEERIRVLEGGTKWLVLPFIRFQYGELNPKNRAHAAIIKALSSDYQTDDIKPLVSPLQAPCKPLTSPLQAPCKPLTSPLQAPCKPLTSPLQAPCKPLTSPLQAPSEGAYEIEKDKEKKKKKQKEKEKQKEIYIADDQNGEPGKQSESFDLDAIWQKYPRRTFKKLAARSFASSVKTDQDYADIFRALDNYLGCKTVKDGFIQNGSTWFNNWRDWVEMPANEPKPTGVEVPSWM